MNGNGILKEFMKYVGYYVLKYVLKYVVVYVLKSFCFDLESIDLISFAFRA